VDAEENTARPIAANQNPFGHLERASLEMVLSTNPFLNIISK